jgi:hypothetical protein
MCALTWTETVFPSVLPAQAKQQLANKAFHYTIHEHHLPHTIDESRIRIFSSNNNNTA